MKVYLSASSHEWRRARLAMEALVRHGHEITYDWTIDVELGGRLFRDCVANELGGVARCDTFLLLVDPRCRGSLVELGAAMALGKIIFSVGDPASIGCFFLEHGPCIVHFSSLDTAIEMMGAIRNKRSA